MGFYDVTGQSHSGSLTVGSFQFLMQKGPLNLILRDHTDNNSNSGGGLGLWLRERELLLSIHKALGSVNCHQCPRT